MRGKGHLKKLSIQEGDRPFIATGQHPIETTHYTLATPAINDSYEKICTWIDNRAPGGIIFGKPRFGKTSAIRYLKEELKTKFSAIPTYVLLCRRCRFPSEASLYEDILRAVNHGLAASGKADAKYFRLIEFLIERAKLSKQDRIILFVDDAHFLHEMHYEWLMNISNALDHQGISLTALLVGQQDLISQRTSFVLGKKEQILGRFMVYLHQFHGIRGTTDIEECLSGYDDNSEYPEGSGWSFTRYFFPVAFQRGWRIRSGGKDLWKALMDIRGELGFHGPTELPMQYFCRTVEYVLRKYGTLVDEIETPSISLAQWKEAIHNSGFIDANRLEVERDASSKKNQ